MVDAKPFTWLSAAYCLINIMVSTACIFVNKSVFNVLLFKFVITLTLIHTFFTYAGMVLFAQAGFYKPKSIPQLKLLPVAAVFVMYIVFGNLSLNINTVGFYQIMKVAVTPTCVLIEVLVYHKVLTAKMVLSVLVVCVGVILATVTDKVAISNTMGLIAGVGCTLTTALYQVWAGTKQKEFEANSSQLLNAYTPQAIGILVVLVACFEPIGWTDPNPATLLGYNYTVVSVCVIMLSAIIGVLVSFTTFLVIGHTSSVTYNMVGHLKTVLIISGGCLLFGEDMSAKRLAGVLMALAGIIWYTWLITSTPHPAQSAKHVGQSTKTIVSESKGSSDETTALKDSSE